MHARTGMVLSHLPVELTLKILSFLGPVDLASAACTSKDLHALSAYARATFCDFRQRIFEAASEATLLADVAVPLVLDSRPDNAGSVLISNAELRGWKQVPGLDLTSREKIYKYNCGEFKAAFTLFRLNTSRIYIRFVIETLGVVVTWDEAHVNSEITMAFNDSRLQFKASVVGSDGTVSSGGFELLRDSRPLAIALFTFLREAMLRYRHVKP